MDKRGGIPPIEHGDGPLLYAMWTPNRANATNLESRPITAGFRGHLHPPDPKDHQREPTGMVPDPRQTTAAQREPSFATYHAVVVMDER